MAAHLVQGLSLGLRTVTYDVPNATLLISMRSALPSNACNFGAALRCRDTFLSRTKIPSACND